MPPPDHLPQTKASIIIVHHQTFFLLPLLLLPVQRILSFYRLMSSFGVVFSSMSPLLYPIDSFQGKENKTGPKTPTKTATNKTTLLILCPEIHQGYDFKVWLIKCIFNIWWKITNRGAWRCIGKKRYCFNLILYLLQTLIIFLSSRVKNFNVFISSTWNLTDKLQESSADFSILNLLLYLIIQQGYKTKGYNII